MNVSAPINDVDLAGLPPRGDALLAEINRLRDSDPLYWSELSHCWIVSGHAEVTEGFSGAFPLSSTQLPKSLYRSMPHDALFARLPVAMRYMPQIITNLDDPDHARIRKLLIKAFNRKLVESLRPYIRDRIDKLFDFAARERMLEFHEGISRMLPGAVILRLLGMSEQYLPQLKRWADGVTTATTSFNPKPEWLDGLEVVVKEMIEVFTAEIEMRRVAPQPDLITQLLNTVEGEARLSMDELLATLILVVVAGHDTTTNSLTLGVREMSRNPAAWQYWRNHPDRSTDCAIELMRYIAMSTAMPRIASTNFLWHGRRIKQGDLIMLMIAGGNRDLHAYEQPEELDFTRTNDTALTFGPGLHHCIGHLLAKVQIGEFFEKLVQRFDKVDVLEEPVFTYGLAFRSVTALQVEFFARTFS